MSQLVFGVRMNAPRSGCPINLTLVTLFREGGNHSIYLNRRARKSSSVPRHREINEFLARKICRDLEIPMP
jgi:mRNA interferase HicA